MLWIFEPLQVLTTAPQLSVHHYLHQTTHHLKRNATPIYMKNLSFLKLNLILIAYFSFLHNIQIYLWYNFFLQVLSTVWAYNTVYFGLSGKGISWQSFSKWEMASFAPASLGLFYSAEQLLQCLVTPPCTFNDHVWDMLAGFVIVWSDVYYLFNPILPRF